MGGDAIIVTRDPKTRSIGSAYVPSQRKKSAQFITTSRRTVEIPRIQVAVIAWKVPARQ